METHGSSLLHHRVHRLPPLLMAPCWNCWRARTSCGRFQLLEHCWLIIVNYFCQLLTSVLVPLFPATVHQQYWSSLLVIHHYCWSLTVLFHAYSPHHRGPFPVVSHAVSTVAAPRHNGACSNCLAYCGATSFNSGPYRSRTCEAVEWKIIGIIAV